MPEITADSDIQPDMVESHSLTTVELARTLRVLRAELGAAVCELTERRTAWERENQALIDMVADLSRRADGCETLLREVAVEEFYDTGDKTPADGVTVRVVSRLRYDEQQALDWARANNQCLRTELDRTAFRRVGASLPFVRREEVAEVVVKVVAD